MMLLIKLLFIRSYVCFVHVNSNFRRFCLLVFLVGWLFVCRAFSQKSSLNLVVVVVLDHLVQIDTNGQQRQFADVITGCKRTVRGCRK